MQLRVPFQYLPGQQLALLSKPQGSTFPQDWGNEALYGIVDVSNAALSVRLLPGTTEGCWVRAGYEWSKLGKFQDPELKVGSTWRQQMVALHYPFPG